ncbi:MAG: GntR family transcriptional regulator [Sneathiella sp.]
MALAEEKPSSSVVRLYDHIKDRAISFSFKPGERINEVDLAKKLGASRTPLREALNRLTAEGLLTFERGRGFFCRDLKPREIFELYQLRSTLEVASARLACELATDDELNAVKKFLVETGSDRGALSSEKLVEFDEIFHEHIVSFTRNSEMARVLKNVNERIKFFRWIDMDNRRNETQHEHRYILQAICARDADKAGELMQRHITCRLDQITAAVKEGYARIYMGTEGLD